MKNILFVASECVPFIKTGGLADVVGSLPRYFDKKKYDVRVIVPKYTAIQEQYKEQMEYIDHFYGSGMAQAICRDLQAGIKRCYILLS